MLGRMRHDLIGRLVPGGPPYDAPGMFGAGAIPLVLKGSALGASYMSRVLATGPIAYWMLAEKSGAVAYDEVLDPNHLDIFQSGDHIGVTLGQTGIGDGNTCPFYDGTNDYTDVQTATLAGRFNGAEGTLMVWAKVANAGVWTDGVGHMAMIFYVDPNNYVRIRRPLANNTITYDYRAGAVNESVLLAGLTTLDWMHLALTWSISAGINGEMRAYYNGAQTGATQVALGVWAGAPIVSLIGAPSLVPATVWHGWEAHGAVWGRALAPAEIADLATV